MIQLNQVMHFNHQLNEFEPNPESCDVERQNSIFISSYMEGINFQNVFHYIHNKYGHGNSEVFHQYFQCQLQEFDQNCQFRWKTLQQNAGNSLSLNVHKYNFLTFSNSNKQFTQLHPISFSNDKLFHLEAATLQKINVNHQNNYTTNQKQQCKNNNNNGIIIKKNEQQLSQLQKHTEHSYCQVNSSTNCEGGHGLQCNLQENRSQQQSEQKTVIQDNQHSHQNNYQCTKYEDNQCGNEQIYISMMEYNKIILPNYGNQREDNSSLNVNCQQQQSRSQNMESILDFAFIESTICITDRSNKDDDNSIANDLLTIKNTNHKQVGYILNICQQGNNKCTNEQKKQHITSSSLSLQRSNEHSEIQYQVRQLLQNSQSKPDYEQQICTCDDDQCFMNKYIRGTSVSGTQYNLNQQYRNKMANAQSKQQSSYEQQQEWLRDKVNKLHIYDYDKQHRCNKNCNHNGNQTLKDVFTSQPQMKKDKHTNGEQSQQMMISVESNENCNDIRSKIMYLESQWQEIEQQQLCSILMQITHNNSYNSNQLSKSRNKKVRNQNSNFNEFNEKNVCDQHLSIFKQQ